MSLEKGERSPSSAQTKPQPHQPGLCCCGDPVPALVSRAACSRIHISVQIPHQDGMLPLISTLPLHNLHFLLSESIYRHQHVCSNLVTVRDLRGISGNLQCQPGKRCGEGSFVFLWALLARCDQQ